MFDDNAQPSGLDMSQRRVKQAGSPMEHDPAQDKPARQMPKKRDPNAISLDTEEMSNQHSLLLSIHRRELDRQWENRTEQAIDEDFFDNIQWDEADAQILRDRGQMPLVYNVISNAINWVTGTEKRSRKDYKILPRRKEDGKPAERKTALMKYVSDVNRSPFHVSRSFEDSVKVGVGWLETGVEDDNGGDPVYSRYESWRNMLWDSAATELDLSDARFISRSKWVDADIISAMFPERASLIEESVEEAGTYASGLEADGDEAMDSHEVSSQQHLGSATGDTVDGFHRPRSRVIEMWFRKPVRTHMMVGGVFGGDLYDFSDAHDEAIHSGSARLVRKLTMRVHVALFTSKGLLWYGESPYRHNRFPFTPIWAYRRGRDGMPYGMIRGLRDIQMDVNKRASKALFILSNNKTIMDEGAVEDIDEYREEAAQPDAVIVKKKGYELKMDADRELAASHLEIMSRSIAMIQQRSGITDELMGRHTNAVSGVAIERRQDQGSTTTTNLFDNLRLATQIHGEKQLSLIEQFYTEQKDFRITSMRGAPEFITLNSGLPDDDITRSKADFIISEADWHATMRQSAVESLLETMKTLPPQVAMVMLDLVVENMDLPNRDEIVKRIRSATGLQDPDAQEPSPEMVAAAQEKQKQAQIQEAMTQAGLAKVVAEAKRAQAQAEQATALAQKVIADAKQSLANAVDLGVDAQSKALDAAIKALSAPPAVPIADHMLVEAGFEGAPEKAQKTADLSRLIAAAHQQQAARELAAQQQQAQAQQSAPGQNPSNGQPGLAMPPPPMQDAPQGAPSPQ
ncbi:MAG: hypothetical protein GC182_08925 [Rhodopseudomonas sp.]|nr:hypothetical protein [Rhodopseudomonas sp.]